MKVNARSFWNATGFRVKAGERYHIRAEGEWVDLTIRTTARGYSTPEAPWYSRSLLSMFEGKRRMPNENWFALIGAIGQDETTAFLIGTERSLWTAPADGELFCFANDIPAAYWNNRGSVTLSIERLE